MNKVQTEERVEFEGSGIGSQTVVNVYPDSSIVRKETNGRDCVNLYRMTVLSVINL